MRRKKLLHELGILLCLVATGCGTSTREREFEPPPPLLENESQFMIDATLVSRLASINGLSRSLCLTELISALSAATLRSGNERMAEKLDQNFEIEITTFCKILRK